MTAAAGNRTPSLCDHHTMNSRTRIVIAALALAGSTLLLAACGGGSGSDEAALSPDAQQGLDVAKSNGCMTCHSPDGRKSVGPTWKGLYDSQVTLVDGEKVTANDEYLTRAILHPSDEIVEGFSGIMPAKDLDQADVDSVIEYIKALKD
ncbi:hypothetical protein BH10ACT3_BH10ACT3_09390 [soil metagenome]